MNKISILQACTVQGQIVKLPDQQLDRQLYLEVKKALELIGGKWKGGNTQGFVFPNDPTPILHQIANGEKRDIKKEYQFFATPMPLANKLVELAEIEEYDNVLEPSAGQGAIIKAIHRSHPYTFVHYFELMELNRSFLADIPNTEYVNDNFLTVRIPATFHKIIANPPFSKNQDIDHIYKMYECLCPGGRIVSIASKHWQFAQGKKECKFKEWLNSVDAEIIDIQSGTFKESGTNVATCIVIINKPE